MSPVGEKCPKLIVGAKYRIDYKSPRHPDNSYQGIGIYRGPADDCYEKGVMEFDLRGQDDVCEMGYFTKDDVVEMVSKPELPVDVALALEILMQEAYDDGAASANEYSEGTVQAKERLVNAVLGAQEG